MSYTFSKTGVHVFPYVWDLSPGDSEEFPFNAESPWVSAEAKLRNIVTDEFLAPDPNVIPNGNIAMVRVTMPDDAAGEIYSLRVTFTNAAGRIWSAAIVIPCVKI